MKTRDDDMDPQALVSVKKKCVPIFFTEISACAWTPRS